MVMTLNDIHVLHVVPTWEVGGMELALAQVAGVLAGEGMRHTVVAIKDAPAPGPRPGDLEVFRMRAGDLDPLLPLRLWRLIRRQRPTVIHAHNWGAWPEVALARLVALRPVPLVFSFHGLPDAGPMPRRRRIAFRVLARMTTRVFTVSQAARRMLVEHVGLPAGRIAVISNGIDTERFAPASRRRRDSAGPTIIGTVGGLTPVKNHAVLLRACGVLAQGGLDLELRIAGSGPLAGELLRLAGALGLDGRLALPGHVDDVPAFLRGLDIFALPSRTEAHPNALLEAMACGLPCVACNVDGIREVLLNGRLGILVYGADPGAMAVAIAELAVLPRRRAALGFAARQHVCQHYSVERMAAEYASLYASVAAGPVRAPAARRPGAAEGA